MALTTQGLTNGGVTTHYSFQYDDSLAQSAANPNGPEPARTNAVIAACEGDYTLMSGWFGGGVNVTGMAVQVTPQTNGASWSGSATSSTVILKPGALGFDNASIAVQAELLRYLIVAEVTEIFMMAQGKGWFQGSDEGSKGEGLSRFLSCQFLIANGLLGTGISRPFRVSDLWLNSARQDFVNNAPNDNAQDATNGCTTLFLYYLSTQLGFSINQIVGAAASTLAGVYQNLTGDASDPFPFFKQLIDNAFPSTTSSAIAGPNIDDPYPLGSLAFWDDKNSFGRDEVADVVAAGGGAFPNAFWLVVEGFNRQVLGAAAPVLGGAALGFPGISITPNPSGIDFELPGNTLVPQRFRFPFDIAFNAASLGGFPASGAPPLSEELDGSIAILGAAFSAATLLEFLAGADPYFTNIDPAQDNVFYLSQDLRVFTATPGLDDTPVPGGPVFASDSIAGAYTYIQQLIGHLNANFSDPAGTDPFDAASHVVPGQAGALSGDSSVTPVTVTFSGFFPQIHANYNFALARVRLRGSQGPAGEAQNVRVFFRMWATQTADTDFQPGSTYPSHLDPAGLPDWPLPATDSHTIPFFATGNSPNFPDPNNPELGATGVNNQTIEITSGDQRWAYFGCFLNVYDPANVVNGSPVLALLTGTHHCLVAQIAFDDAPIVNAGGVTQSPETSDKLAQRNLQVTVSDNPGPPATHRIPQTFDLRPSPALIEGQGDMLDYPDELMIDWGRTPPGSLAQIYWPQAYAAQILDLADALYGRHGLSAADPHTIQLRAVRGVSYVPIPPGGGANLAGLFTVDLPQTVVRGQEFDILLRRVGTRRNTDVILQARGPEAARRQPAELPRAGRGRGPTTDGAPYDDKPGRPLDRRQKNWRYVIGTFQVKIPVSTAELILPAEENTLAIFKWRLQQMNPANRWYPVLQRYIAYVSARVDGLGGNAGAIEPSPGGVPPVVKGEPEPEPAAIGKVCEVVYDCFGDFEGFVVETCPETRSGRHSFRSREKAIGALVVRALRERLVLSVFVERHSRRIEKLVLRC